MIVLCADAWRISLSCFCWNNHDRFAHHTGATTYSTFLLKHHKHCLRRGVVRKSIMFLLWKHNTLMRRWSCFGHTLMIVLCIKAWCVNIPNNSLEIYPPMFGAYILQDSLILFGSNTVIVLCIVQRTIMTLIGHTTIDLCTDANWKNIMLFASTENWL